VLWTGVARMLKACARDIPGVYNQTVTMMLVYN
jgi:hypothetical protein